MRKIRFLVQMLISAICIGVVISMLRLEDLSGALKKANLFFLGVVLVLMPAAIFFRAWRWQFILRRKQVPVPLTVMYRVTFIGIALNLVLPAGLGAAVRSYYGWRERGHKEAMLASAVSDKVVALLTLFILGLLCAVALGLYKIALLTAALSIPIAVVLFVPRIVPWRLAKWLLRKIARKDLAVDLLHESFRMDAGTLAGCVVLSVLGWCVTNLMYYFACLSFAPNVSVWFLFAVAPLINLMRFLPITVAGLGSADLMTVVLFKLANVNESDAFLVAMTINIVLLALPGLIGAGLMPMTGRKAPGAGRDLEPSEDKPEQ